MPVWYQVLTTGLQKFCKINVLTVVNSREITVNSLQKMIFCMHIVFLCLKLSHASVIFGTKNSQKSREKITLLSAQITEQHRFMHNTK